MFENKIKKKLEKMLADIDSDKINEITEMIKSGDNFEKNIDLNKASNLIKSLDLENDITPEMISRGISTLKENPEILSELKKK